MIVLGLNAYGHDAAAVLLIDGEAVFAASEERYDRRRHSASFPQGAIDAALAHGGLRAADVDRIAFPWARGMARWRKLAHVLRGWPATRAYWRERPEGELPGRAEYLRQMRGLEAAVRARGFVAPVVRVAHHRAHAVSASLVLPGGTGAVVTADGMGEWTTTATWRVDHGRPRPLHAASYPHSAGKAYAAVTQWLGFRPESDEGKTMGLAAYGRAQSGPHRFARSLVRPAGRRLLRLRTSAFSFPQGRRRLWGDAFLTQAGPPRTEGTTLDDVHRDVARGLQDAIEATFREVAGHLLEATRAPALGLAGGLFLNCALNGSLARSLGVRVLPFPVAGDAGAAWGAAACVWQEASGQPAAALTTLRLGHDLHDAEVRAALGSRAVRLPDLVDEVARRVAAGQLVGVARGRAEFGPRALGGRSVLATPTSLASRDRVNAHKGREAWRPLAPVVLEGDRTFFRDLHASPWMILTFEATEAAQLAIPGAVHADGTARVQTIGPRDDAFLRDVLSRLPAYGHPPVVLNTSLNRRGEPIVNTAQEALAAARAMELDALVAGDHLLSLREATP